MRQLTILYFSCPTPIFVWFALYQYHERWALRTYPGLHFVTEINTTIKGKLESKGFIELTSTNHSPLLREVDRSQEAEVRLMDDICLGVCVQAHIWFPFLYLTGPLAQGQRHPQWTRPSRSSQSSRKCRPICPQGKYDGGVTPLMFPPSRSFELVLSWQKTSQHRAVLTCRTSAFCSIWVQLIADPSSRSENRGRVFPTFSPLTLPVLNLKLTAFFWVFLL